jgi:hypothetical protein
LNNNNWTSNTMPKDYWASIKICGKMRVFGN